MNKISSLFKRWLISLLVFREWHRSATIFW